MKQGQMAGTAAKRMIAAGFAFALAVLGAQMIPAALAQNVSSNFGGFSGNSNEPIDIEADTLEVQDGEKIAIFSGNVKAVQGKMIMRSKKLKVKYSGKPAGSETPDARTVSADGKKKSGSQITSIRAEGKVLIESGDDQTATSSWAFFDVIKQTVTLGGDVVLSQGGNVLKGDKLIIDLKTNTSRIVNLGDGSKRQRVRGLFMPQKSGAQ